MDVDLIKLAFKLGYSRSLEKYAQVLPPEQPEFQQPQPQQQQPDLQLAQRGRPRKAPAIPVQSDYQPSERVQAYFNNLVPAIKKNSGVPGRDYNASRYRPNFWQNVEMRANVENSTDPDDMRSYQAHTTGGRNASGWARPAYGRNPAKIRFVGTPDDETVVHELKHYQNMDGDFEHHGAGRSNLDNQRLQAGYGFAGDDVASTYPNVNPELLPQYAQDEQATTHGQYQFRVFNNLWNQLGREPTTDEFLQHVDNMSDDELMQLRENYGDAANRYFQRAINRHVWDLYNDPNYDESTFPDVKNFRNALKTVAQLGRERNQQQPVQYQQPVYYQQQQVMNA